MEIARVSRRVSLRNGYEAQLEFTLHESDAFGYGNGTSVVMRDRNAMNGFSSEERYDTRYDTSLNADGSNFSQWVRDFIKCRFEGLTV